MTEKRAFASFPALPIELKQHIFNHVRKPRDRSAARLLSREWKDASDPVFWREIFLSETCIQIPTCLIVQNSGLLGLVRDLTIQHYAMELETGQGRLLPLYANGQLIKLRFERGVETGLLTSMLKHNPRLQSLTVKMTDSSIHKGNFESFQELVNALSQCRELAEVHLGGYDRKRVDTLVDVLFGLPKLRRVSLSMSMSVSDLDTDHTSPLERGDVLDVEYLSLTRISSSGLYPLGPRFEGLYLDGIVKLENLKVLKLSLSSEPDGLAFAILEHLSTSFSSMGDQGIALKSLELSVTPSCAEEFKDAIEKTITSFHGLETLIIGIASLGPINRSCIEHHASTLVNFCQFSREERSVGDFTLEDIASILKACQNLSMLAIHLPPFKLDRPSEHVMGNNSTPRLNADLRKYLETIAAHKNLRALRVLNHSCPDRAFDDGLEFYEEHTDLGFNTWGLIYREFAYEVVEYLGLHGSSLKLLCLTPFHDAAWRVPSGTDHDGQVHPNYYYACTRADQERLTTVPFPEAPYELPNLELMFRDFTQPDQLYASAIRGAWSFR